MRIASSVNVASRMQVVIWVRVAAIGWERTAYERVVVDAQSGVVAQAGV